jgi:putative drug exporter of the RND superfamily
MKTDRKTRTSLLGRLANLAYRRRGRMVLAWIAVFAVVVTIGPRLAGEFGEDYSTPGSGSKAAAALLADRLAASSGDTIDVVWQAPRGVDDWAVEARMERFLERGGRLEGIGAADAPQVSADGTIAVARLQLDRPSWDVPAATSSELVDIAEATSGSDLRIELGGGTIEEEGAPPELMAFLAADLAGPQAAPKLEALAGRLDEVAGVASVSEPRA